MFWHNRESGSLRTNAKGFNHLFPTLNDMQKEILKLKKFKFVYMAFLPFDYEYIEKKLTPLAAEGYELETVGIAFWKFRK